MGWSYPSIESPEWEADKVNRNYLDDYAQQAYAVKKVEEKGYTVRTWKNKCEIDDDAEYGPYAFIVRHDVCKEIAVWWAVLDFSKTLA